VAEPSLAGKAVPATLGYSKIDHSMQKLQYLDAWDLVRQVSQGLLRAPQKPHSRRHDD
jgi:hypothetical protein